MSITPTRDALQAAVAVLMREAEQKNNDAANARKHLNSPDHGMSERVVGYLREQMTNDLAESCRLASVAGWLQAEANRSGAASAAVTHGHADAS